MENAVNYVDRAIAVYGTAVELADTLGISHQAISLWRKNGRVSFRFTAKVSALTGIPEHLLCPDYFRPPERKKREAKQESDKA